MSFPYSPLFLTLSWPVPIEKEVILEMILFYILCSLPSPDLYRLISPVAWGHGGGHPFRLWLKWTAAQHSGNHRVEGTNDWNGFRAERRCSTSESPLPALARVGPSTCILYLFSLHPNRHPSLHPPPPAFCVLLMAYQSDSLDSPNNRQHLPLSLP